MARSVRQDLLGDDDEPRLGLDIGGRPAALARGARGRREDHVQALYVGDALRVLQTHPRPALAPQQLAPLLTLVL